MNKGVLSYIFKNIKNEAKVNPIRSSNEEKRE